MAKIVRHEELSTATSQPEDRLRSWKEIAVYLRREVRTVQRWEKQEGLPVHRHVHNKHSSVYAEKAELEAWWKNRKAQLEEEGKADDEVIAPVAWWRRPRFVWVAILGSAVAGIGLLWPLRTRPRPDRPPIPVPLTVYAGRESEPSFSPDGNQIAFCWNGKGQDNADIYVKLVGPGGDPIRLTTHPAWDHSPAWSLDGSYVAFLRRSSAEKDTVFLVPALGGMETRVSDVSGVVRGLGMAAHLTWSSDSKWLVVPDKASPGEPYSLFLLSVHTGEKRRLTTPPAHLVGDTGPSLSPSGRQLVFIRNFGRLKGDLYLLSLSETLTPQGDPKRLTFLNSFAHSPSWTSDGSEVVFSFGDVGIGLWRVRASGVGEAIPLAFDGAAAGFHPTISHQGRRLAYTHQVADANIWQAELAAPGGPARKPRSVVSSSSGDLNASYSPDGKQIAFTSIRSGNRSIWVCEKDGSRAVQLTSKGGSPSWSPDGKHVAFVSNTDGQWEIYVTGVLGGQPQRLTIHESDDEFPSWSRDGRWVYFASNRSGDYQVWKVPAIGGQALQVTQQGGLIPLESPDGEFLYYGKSKPNSLWRKPQEGGAESLVSEIAEFRLTDLVVVNEGIYLLTHRSQDLRNPGASISFFNLATGKLNSVLAIEKPISSGLSVSPDGKSILYSQLDYYDTGIMLVENFR